MGDKGGKKDKAKNRKQMKVKQVQKEQKKNMQLKTGEVAQERR